jgi:hypothetical protein
MGWALRPVVWRKAEREVADAGHGHVLGRAGDGSRGRGDNSPAMFSTSATADRSSMA